MATTTGASTSSNSSTTQEYTVRIPKDKQKNFSMMKFGTGGDLDFAKLGNTTISIARENNLKEFKTANDIDLMPKFGAGSEFGREQKEEARRKKYGRMTRNYNPEDQPWIMKVGTDKKAKRYKGVREGTITENTSYYIFTQCADGAFEAYPVDEWYNFTPVIKYKFLNADEAEEHFSRRDKTLNFFNIMAKNRMKGVDGTEENPEEKEDANKKKKTKKDFMLTDDDDWREESEDEDGDDEDEDEEGGGEKKNKKGKNKKKKKGPVKKRKKNAKINSDDEAIEESDEGDYDDREVDYMSDSSSNPSEKEEEDKEKDTKDEEKGVAEEDGLRVLIDSEAEEEAEEENKEKEENIDDIDKDLKKKKDDESDSSSSSSASDSDIEKETSINSALFITKATEKKKTDSRPSTPNIDERGVKRKIEADGASGKKARTESPVPTSSSSATTSSSATSSSASEGITEEAIRRYLMRKPMTTRDLTKKFRSKKLNMTTEQMTHTVAQLLKKINPEKEFINKVLYLSLKKTD